MSAAQDLLRAIEAAADARAKGTAATAIAELRATAFDGVSAVDAELSLKKVIARRWFDLAARLGEPLDRTFSGVPGISRRYGQSLIEIGQLAQARAHFERLLEAGPAPTDRDECIGFIGRTLKQECVVLRNVTGVIDAGLLARAIDRYIAGYRNDEKANTWHGINAVALLMFAQRHGVNDARVAEAGDMARAIVDAIRLMDGRKYWDDATLAEAYVALGRWDDAARQLHTYLWHPDANAFSFGSTLRQFEEIWEFDDSSDPGASLLALLRSRLLEVEDGSLQLQPSQIRRTLQNGAGFYQKVFGNDRFTTLSNYRMGLQRCAAVARISRDLDVGEGTGFLLRGSDVDRRLGPEPVLVTNAHVVDPTGASGGIAPGNALVTFHAMDGVDPATVFTIKECIWCSDCEKLDVTIARLDGPPALVDPYPIEQQAPKKGDRVIAIGHPGGGALSLSLNDNELIDLEVPGFRMHYRTPTIEGSSGSPIFTRDWKLVSLHHAGLDDMPRLNGQQGTYQANEGISFLAIRDALAATLV